MRGSKNNHFIMILLLFLFASSVLVIPSADYGAHVKINEPVATPAAISYFNASNLFETIWAETSLDNIGNNTKDLSEYHPFRIWDAITGANANLTAAWDWANDVLEANTGGDLSFSQITEYQHLIAIQNGTGPSPRPALIITGMMDSEFSPGANDAAASVAVVLEIARVLHDYDLAYDVYYVLLNGVHLDEDTDIGGGAFVDWVIDNGVNTFTLLSLDRLLFSRHGYLYASKINIRSYSASDNYHDAEWIPNMMVQVSSMYGRGYFQRVYDLEQAERSAAYEMWQEGCPGLYITQGYYMDPQSSTDDDTWDNPDFSLKKGHETAATIASVAAYMGILGTGQVPQRYMNGWLNTTESANLRLTTSIQGFLNGTVTWDNATTLKIDIIDSLTNEVVYQRIEDDGVAVLKYLVQDLGAYHFSITDIGAGATNFTLTVDVHEDMDGDSIKDFAEISLGTSPYLRDSDLDGLSDDFEINVGSDPASPDSDGDGASDYDEYIWGSSLLSNDTDGDLITDSMEAQLGTNPTSDDSDNDGIDDYTEVYVLFSNPTSADTDQDGLEDGFEYEVGLNLLSPDTDGDSLSDLFEVLNGLSPFLRDTDGDGWSDAYEVEYCMLPNNADSDGDGIPDGIDWDPLEHWVTVVSPVALLSVILLMLVYAFLKMRLYRNN